MHNYYQVTFPENTFFMVESCCQFECYLPTSPILLYIFTRMAVYIFILKQMAITIYYYGLDVMMTKIGLVTLSAPAYVLSFLNKYHPFQYLFCMKSH